MAGLELVEALEEPISEEETAILIAMAVPVIIGILAPGASGSRPYFRYSPATISAAHAAMSLYILFCCRQPAGYPRTAMDMHDRLSDTWWTELFRFTKEEFFDELLPCLGLPQEDFKEDG